MVKEKIGMKGNRERNSKKRERKCEKKLTKVEITKGVICKKTKTRHSTKHF
jgi:hypothetical protein